MNCAWHTGMEERMKAICIKVDAVEKLFEDRDRQNSERTKLAREEIERRLHLMNEIRGSLVDQARLFITKVEVDLIIKHITDKIETLTSEKDKKTGENNVKIVVASAFISTLVGIAIHWASK
jgi:hypothetical protein